jgi:hypothetical protein
LLKGAPLKKDRGLPDLRIKSVNSAVENLRLMSPK